MISAGQTLAIELKGLLRSNLQTKWVSHPSFAQRYGNLPMKYPYIAKTPHYCIQTFSKEKHFYDRVAPCPTIATALYTITGQTVGFGRTKTVSQLDLKKIPKKCDHHKTFLQACFIIHKLLLERLFRMVK